MKSSGFAPGKLIISGEHAVVYGHPALAVAVNLGVHIQLAQRPGPTAQELNNQDLRAALRTILPADNIGISIQSALPMGCGMGSSAAISIATLRAWDAWNEQESPFDSLYQRAFAMEKVFHGNPSGVDHAVSALGSGLLYQKTEPRFQAISFPQLRLVVMNTGIKGNTADLVAKVKANYPKNQPIIQQIGALTKRIHQALSGPLPNLGQLLNENHHYLQQLGVSTPELDLLVEEARLAGAYGAKLSGAGGGGIAIALSQDPNHLIYHIESLGYTAFEVHTLSKDDS